MSAAAALAPELPSIYANEANVNHARVRTNSIDSFDAAICVGRALIDAQADLRARGKHTFWLLWLHQNVEFSEQQARQYMQIARREEELRRLKVVGVDEAMRIIHGERRERRLTQPEKAEMLQMRDAGDSVKDIAEKFEVSASTASRWISHEQLKREPAPVARRQRAERNITITDAMCAVLHDALRTYEWHGVQAWPESNEKIRRALRTALHAALEVCR